jgi:hypothetical protein
VSNVRVLLAIAIVGTAGVLQAQGTAKADEPKLSTGTEVRIASSALPPGWHEGKVTTAKVSNSRMCYGVAIKAASTRTGKAVALFEGVDSIDVKVTDNTTKKADWKRLDAKALKDKYPACKTNP